MTSLLWTLIAIQIAMGVFDTFYHHELTERLAWRPSQRYELQLHARAQHDLRVAVPACSAGSKFTACSRCSSSRCWSPRSSSR